VVCVDEVSGEKTYRDHGYGGVAEAVSGGDPGLHLAVENEGGQGDGDDCDLYRVHALDGRKTQVRADRCGGGDSLLYPWMECAGAGRCGPPPRRPARWWTDCPLGTNSFRGG
jgi:hypothetical protein